MNKILTVLLLVFAMSLFVSVPEASAKPVRLHKVHVKHHKHRSHHQRHHHKTIVAR